jgi:hypothetical protein
MRNYIPENVSTIEEVNFYLSEILEERLHPFWWETTSPNLDGKSPRKAWFAGEKNRVIDLVDGYFDPSYS